MRNEQAGEEEAGARQAERAEKRTEQAGEWKAKLSRFCLRGIPRSSPRKRGPRAAVSRLAMTCWIPACAGMHGGQVESTGIGSERPLAPLGKVHVARIAPVGTRLRKAAATEDGGESVWGELTLPASGRALAFPLPWGERVPERRRSRARAGEGASVYRESFLPHPARARYRSALATLSPQGRGKESPLPRLSAPKRRLS